MNLDDALRMATNTVVEPVVSNITTPVAPAPVVSPEQLQAQAQVVQPTTTATVQPVAVQPMPVQHVAYTPVQASIDLNQAADDAMQSYGVESIQIGQTISTRVIDPVKKYEKGDSFRFTIIAPDAGSIRVHNHPTLGKIRCFSSKTNLAQCCQELGDPRPRYFLPVLVYSTMPNDPTMALPQGKSELRLLVVWDSTSWAQLGNEIKAAGNDYKIDIVATSEDTYGKLSFRAQRDSFRAIPEYQSAIQQSEAKWAQIKDRAVETVCRDLDAVRYAQLSKQAAVPQMQDYSMNDVM